MFNAFTEENFHSLCDELSFRDSDLKKIITLYGYPPFWSRKPGFATLIHILLEQQVSLASAKAALEKLRGCIGVITPVKVKALSPEEMKACYFSRQKIVYAKQLAEAIITKQLNLKKLATHDETTIRETLKKIKGIGDWTVDVYLMMALHHRDCFPLGDIALVKSLKEVKGLPQHTSKEEIAEISNAWYPYRTIAAFLLWHAYLSRRKAGKSVRPKDRKAEITS